MGVCVSVCVLRIHWKKSIVNLYIRSVRCLLCLILELLLFHYRLVLNKTLNLKRFIS